MPTLYLLEHSHSFENPDISPEVKSLGCYSIRERALAAAERYRPLPGLRENPDGFRVVEWEIQQEDPHQAEPAAIPTTAWWLSHHRGWEDPDADGEDLNLGFYATLALGEAALRRFQHLPEFSDAPGISRLDNFDGFGLYEITLDKGGAWDEGFFTHVPYRCCSCDRDLRGLSSGHCPGCRYPFIVRGSDRAERPDSAGEIYKPQLVWETRPRCGHDLTHVSLTVTECPECGRARESRDLSSSEDR